MAARKSGRRPTPGVLCFSLAVLVWLAVCGGCPGDPYPEVELSGEGEGPRARTDADGQPVLRVAVAAVVAPLSSHEHYSKLVERVGELEGSRVHFIQRKSYAEINALVLSGEVDLAFLCTGGFLALEKSAPGLEPLCVPQINGEVTYQSYLIVAAGSSFGDLTDLQGKRFAFTDPLSQTGCLWPSYLLRRLGRKPDEFFRQVVYTGSHDRSIKAVALGVVEAAAVDNLVFDEMLKRESELADQVRIMAASPKFGMPPVVASPKLSPERRERLRRIFLELHLDEKGRHFLAHAGIERYLPVPPGLYDSARAILPGSAP